MRLLSLSVAAITISLLPLACSSSSGPGAVPDGSVGLLEGGAADERRGSTDGTLDTTVDASDAMAPGVDIDCSVLCHNDPLTPSQNTGYDCVGSMSGGPSWHYVQWTLAGPGCPSGGDYSCCLACTSVSEAGPEIPCPAGEQCVPPYVAIRDGLRFDADAAAHCAPIALQDSGSDAEAGNLESGTGD